MFNFKRSLAGPGYVILNCIRVLNIVALGAVMAASIVMLIRGLVVSQFFFFDAISHLVTFFLSSTFPHLPLSPTLTQTGSR